MSASEKSDACDSFGGKSLGKCGFFLSKRLLEVLPLRSQSTGKGNKKGVFPLPTSRSCFLDLDPFLSEEELSWVFCVCLSLNSIGVVKFAMNKWQTVRRSDAWRTLLPRLRGFVVSPNWLRICSGMHFLASGLRLQRG